MEHENQSLSRKVVKQRGKLGLSQERLAENTGLSLRTVQRIEKGESTPRGNTLKKLAKALDLNAEDLLDMELSDAPNMLVILNLSQLSFLIFPFFGILLPLAIWLGQKSKVRQVHTLGCSIINFQITWCLSFFLVQIIGLVVIMATQQVKTSLFHSFAVAASVLYIFNVVVILINTLRSHANGKVWYQPAIPILR